MANYMYPMQPTHPTHPTHPRLVKIAEICIGLGPFSLNLPPPTPFSANLWIMHFPTFINCIVYLP